MNTVSGVFVWESMQLQQMVPSGHITTFTSPRWQCSAITVARARRASALPCDLVTNTP